MDETRSTLSTLSVRYRRAGLLQPKRYDRDENRDIPVYLDGLVRSPGRVRRQPQLELITVNFIEQFLNNLFDSDELSLIPRREPCQQSPDSPALVPVDVMESYFIFEHCSIERAF